MAINNEISETRNSKKIVIKSLIMGYLEICHSDIEGINRNNMMIYFRDLNRNIILNFSFNEFKNFVEKVNELKDFLRRKY